MGAFLLTWLSNLEQAMGLALHLCLFFAMLSTRGFRSFPTIFIYNAVYFCTSAAEVIAVRYFGNTSQAYRSLYWFNDALLLVLLYVVLFSLQGKVSANNPTLVHGARRVMVGVGVAALLIVFLLSRQPVFSLKWFLFESQVLNFGGAIMNLVLWSTLIVSRQREPHILLVCAGLGVAVAGQAIFNGVYLVGATRLEFVRIVALQINALTHLLGVAIWCYAFWPKKRDKNHPPEQRAPASTALSAS